MTSTARAALVTGCSSGIGRATDQGGETFADADRRAVFFTAFLTDFFDAVLRAPFFAAFLAAGLRFVVAFAILMSP